MEVGLLSQPIMLSGWPVLLLARADAAGICPVNGQRSLSPSSCIRSTIHSPYGLFSRNGRSSLREYYGLTMFPRSDFGSLFVGGSASRLASFYPPAALIVHDEEGISPHAGLLTVLVKLVSAFSLSGMTTVTKVHFC